MDTTGLISNLELLPEVLVELAMFWEDMAFQNDLRKALKRYSAATARIGRRLSFSSPILDACAAVDGIFTTIALQLTSVSFKQHTWI